MTITALYRGKSKKTGKWYYGSYLKLNSSAARPEHFIVSNYSGIMTTPIIGNIYDNPEMYKVIKKEADGVF